MAKAKDTVFFCKECGYESAKWQGQCPACHEWNTLVEAPKAASDKRGFSGTAFNPLAAFNAAPVAMPEVEAKEENRILTGSAEFDRVLGGGIVKGSLTLIGGDPGIGKSTILTQICKNLSDSGHSVLYISGEESPGQIKLRADRLGEFSSDMKLFCETNLDTITKVIEKDKPEVAVIDSIQTMYRPDVENAPGSMSQIRESTHLLMQMAKGLGIAVFVVGHVTKEGVVAGPRMLEHMVDTVLYFEGDSQASFRLLRSVKNRFGSTNEIGVFEMRSDGLKEVSNPSEYLLVGRPEDSAGSIVSCAIEGTRPILVEIQALVSASSLGNPRRSSTGIDYNRMNLLLAVMEKRLGLVFADRDVYVNIVGGLKVNETALDLAVILVIASSMLDKQIDPHTVAIGEIGLSGEVRNTNMTDIRIREAVKLGFKTVIMPGAALDSVPETEGVRFIGVDNVRQAAELLFAAS